MKSLRVKRTKDEDEQMSNSLPNLSDQPRKPPVAPPRRDLTDSQTFQSNEDDRLLDEEWNEALMRTEKLALRQPESPKSNSSAHLPSSSSSSNPQVQRAMKADDQRTQSNSSLKKETKKYPKDVIRIGSQNSRDLFDRYDTFLFDMDGVLWQGNKIIQNSIETIHFLKEANKNIYFITNNSTKSRASYVKKLKKLGLDIDKNHCFGSASMTALFLQHCKQFNCDTDRVYVIGESGILAELEDVGIQYVYDHVLPVPDDLNDIIIKPDPSIKAVIMGFDLNVNYMKLCKAHYFITMNNALFIATNDDQTYPIHGISYPGTGSLIACVSTSTETSPIICGKPSSFLVDLLNKKGVISAKTTIMMGDRINTDILFAKNAGIDSCLVLSGVSKLEDIDQHDIKPTYFMERIGVMYESLAGKRN